MLIRQPIVGSRPCKICEGTTHLCGVVDFERSCVAQNRAAVPLSGTAIYYRRCVDCEFLFTEAFDEWDDQSFREHIYNDDYIKVDPAYAAERPLTMASRFLKRAGHILPYLNVLDYGGGTGAFASHLRSAGIARAETYDPFSADFAQRPDGTFNLVTCYECIEHVSWPLQAIRSMADILDDDGVVHVGTGLLTNGMTDADAMHWWYVGPRNGHISIFSRKATVMAWASVGMTVEFIDGNSYAAFRNRAGWAERFLDIPLPEWSDADTYFVFNPDVKRVGMDAATHYRRFGMFEGRKWRADAL